MSFRHIKGIALLLIIITLISCSQQSAKTTSGQSDVDDCKKRWKILEPKTQMVGKVMFHATPGIACGVLATGSVTIIQTANGDVFRVIELCNLEKKFTKGMTVRVEPHEKINIPLIPADPQECILRETLFGVLTESR